MNENPKTKRPWMVAVWPGMGHVAVSAGYYLMAKLGMQYLGEFTSSGVFDVDFAIIKSGLVQKPQRPRSRFFLWKAPEGKRDIIVFLGEAQPPQGKFEFCESLIDFARDQGVERIFTFAAMATEMHPQHDSRIFGAATDAETLGELDRPEIRFLEEGHIGGLNGVLLAAAVDKGMPGVCLLGEMPHLFSQIPFPKASLAVLEIFADMAEIPLDFTELTEQAKAIEVQLGQLLAKVEKKMQSQESQDSQPADEFIPDEAEEDEEEVAEQRLPEADNERIESLFSLAQQDRSKAYELKNELDRLGVFGSYEDRFLDLFKNTQ